MTHTGCNFGDFILYKGSHSFVFRAAWFLDGASHVYLDFSEGLMCGDDTMNSELFEWRFTTLDTLDDRMQHPGLCWVLERVQKDVRNLLQPLPDCKFSWELKWQLWNDSRRCDRWRTGSHADGQSGTSPQWSEEPWLQLYIGIYEGEYSGRAEGICSPKPPESPLFGC